MSAIRPNKNFDNEHKEHVPYQNKAALNMQDAYNRIMKADPNLRHRPPAIKDNKVYKKWFNSK